MKKKRKWDSTGTLGCERGTEMRSKAEGEKCKGREEQRKAELVATRIGAVGARSGVTQSPIMPAKMDAATAQSSLLGTLTAHHN